jgi:hypothetical protein
VGRGIKGEGSLLTASNRHPKIQHARAEPDAPANAGSALCDLLLDAIGPARLHWSLCHEETRVHRLLGLARHLRNRVRLRFAPFQSLDAAVASDSGT